MRQQRVRLCDSKLVAIVLLYVFGPMHVAANVVTASQDGYRYLLIQTLSHLCNAVQRLQPAAFMMTYISGCLVPASIRLTPLGQLMRPWSSDAI